MDDSDSTKCCTQCGQTKPLCDFHRKRANKSDGRKAACQECENAVNRVRSRILRATRKQVAPIFDADHRRHWSENTNVPYGYCWCGCGQRTRLSPSTDRAKGQRRGCPCRFVPHHQGKLRGSQRGTKFCRGCGDARPLSDFYRRPDGCYYARCRECFGDYMRLRRLPDTTIAQWQALREWYEDTCLCCGIRQRMTVDHIVPFSKGGAGDIQNIQPLCMACNRKKGAKTIDYRDPDLHAEFMDALRSTRLL